MRPTCHYCTEPTTEVVHAKDGCVPCCPRHAAWRKSQPLLPGHGATCRERVPARSGLRPSSFPPFGSPKAGAS